MATGSANPPPPYYAATAAADETKHFPPGYAPPPGSAAAAAIPGPFYPNYTQEATPLQQHPHGYQPTNYYTYGMQPGPYQPQYSSTAAAGYPQQQQSVVVVSGGEPMMPGVILPPVTSFTGYIVLSCFVFWCCGWLFGLIAFLLAVAAQNNAPTDPTGARRLGKASLAVSVAGIVVGIIVIVVIVVVFVAYGNQVTDCVVHGKYFIRNVCYEHRDWNYLQCNAIYHRQYFWDGIYCYYNDY